jgi:hypothetical protein
MARRGKNTNMPGFQQKRKKNKQGVRGRITNDTRLTGHSYCNTTTTDATGLDCFMVLLSAGEQPSTTGPARFGFVVSSSIRQVAACYQEYKYLPGTKLHWEPRVAVTSTGNYWIGYIDNPELIIRFMDGANTIERAAIARSIDTMRIYPIWQSASCSIGPSRRSSYNVNVTLDTDINNVPRSARIAEIERSCQGAFIFLIEGGNPSTVTAQPYLTEILSLKGLTGLPANTT